MNDYKELINKARLYRKLEHSSIVLSVYDEMADAIEQLVKERDAAVADLKEYCDCDVCKNNNDECLNSGLCKECSVGKSTRHHWEWRGVQK